MLSENIKYHRKKSKLTQKELAEKLGVAPTAVSAWELGRNKPLMDNIEKMSSIFGVKKSDIISDGQEDMNFMYDELFGIYEQLEPPRQVKVYNYTEYQLEEQKSTNEINSPSIIYGRSTAAGSARYVDDGDAYEVKPDSIVPKGADELVTVVGDSMIPLIENGAKVYIRHQPTVKQGEVAIVRIENEGVTCKRVYLDGDTVVLKSENDLYDDMKFSHNQVTILGRVLL